MQGQIWEYLPVHITAEVKKHEAYIKDRWPNNEFPKYDPVALTPELDELGKQGWELVHMSIHEVGVNGDIHALGSWTEDTWTHTYLCVFKRPKQA